MVALNTFHLGEEQRQLFAATLLIDKMEREKKSYDVLLDSGDADLECTLQWLLMKQLIQMSKEHRYELSPRGHAKAKEFATRYQTLLAYFDVFAHVDLEAGEFAMASHGDFSSEAAWQSFLDQERWHDMRIAAIEHLGGSGVELVFAHFVREDRFDMSHDHWQFELKHGVLWDEIPEICNSAIRKSELAYHDGEQEVSGDAVMDDIVEQGFAVLRERYPSDPTLHSNLQAWYPRRGYVNHDLPVPLPGWEKPIWQTPWTL
ncbi:hypothetical protein Rhal01_02987 [Rubritalea halochordaticola]|uniref:DUF4274 domain-containing protein n=1 Tax=Rubritalea halochordaticola TaxID=714537 RepID=A0ABP9V619_9BACT